MARTRNIKPAFFDNDTLGSLDPLIRLLFIGLWCIADRDGRLEDRPRRIKKTLLGYDDATAEETSGMLQQLEDNGFIIRYEANGEKYIQVINFRKHQNPNMKEKASEIPPPPGFEAGTYIEHSTSTVQALCKEVTDTTPKPAQTNTDTAKAPKDNAEKTLLEMRFSAFWEAYPKKKAKVTALKAWMRIKPTAELFEKIMSAVEKYKHSQDWLKENGAYIPNPTTWLNGGCWDDEIKEVTTGGASQQYSGGGTFSQTNQSRQGSGTPAGFKSD
ncbi:MAG: phage replication protein [Firmicutes bacterium]|nr:phage replication protein [Bacillota bacterium]